MATSAPAAVSAAASACAEDSTRHVKHSIETTAQKAAHTAHPGIV
jgi:hypothetical protein